MSEAESLINLGTIEPVIIVCSNNGSDPYLGSFFVNSIVSGDYEDFNINDLINWLENTYRVVPEKNYRTLMGQSMGGYGCFRYGILHKDLFRGFAAHGSSINHYLSINEITQDVLDTNPPGPPYSFDFYNTDILTKMIFAMSAAFSPNLSSPQTYINPQNVEFPLDEQGQLIDSVYQKWVVFDPVSYLDTLQPEDSVAILFGAGANDEWHLYDPNVAMQDSLDQAGLDFEFYDHNGSHGMPVGFRDRALIFLDSIMPPPKDLTCFPPSDLFADNITQTTADLSWTENGSATSWQIRLEETGFDTTGFEPVTVNTNPYTWTGLSENTSYDWYIRADCSGGQVSNWIGPNTFFVPATNSILFFEDWESESGSRKTDGLIYLANNYEWSFNTNSQNEGRVSWGENAYMAYSGNGSLTLDRSSLGSTTVNYAILTFDLSGYTASSELEFSFWWADHRDDEHTNDKVWIRGSDTNIWVEIYDIDPKLYANDVYNFVSELDIDFTLSNLTPPQTVSETFQVRFGQEGKFDVPKDGISFDDIMIEDFSLANNCIEPSNQSVINIASTTAVLSWTENGSATSWQMRFGKAGFDTVGMTPAMIANDTITVDTLLPSTSYEWYVRAYCGEGDSSQWVGPDAFNTACGIPDSLLAYDITDTLATLKWKETGIASQWQIRLGQFPFDTLGVEPIAVIEDTITVDSLRPSSSYEWYVRAYCGEGDSSEWVGPNTFNTACGIPDSLLTYRITDTLATLKWKETGIASQWQVRLGQFPFDTLGVEPIAVIEDTITVDSLRPSTSYEWYVRAYCGEGDSSEWVGPNTFNTACGIPDSLLTYDITDTLATLKWKETGIASQWQIRLGQVPFDTLGVEPISVIEDTITVDSLQPSTSYEWYVRAYCGEGDSSMWAGPYSFITKCDPFTAAFTENFDGTTAPGLTDCWNGLASDTIAFVGTVDSLSVSASNSVLLFNDSLNAGFFGLVSPEFSDLTSLANQIRFSARAYGDTAKLFVGTMTDPFDTLTYSPFDTLVLVDEFKEFIVKFDEAYTGADLFVVLRHGLLDSAVSLFVDDFFYEVIPQQQSMLDPIAHWSMDDVSGTTVTDSSGNNLHGVLVNGAQWDSNGKISGAVSCDGENDYVEIPDDDLLDPGSSDFTVSFWVYKRVSSSGYDNIWGVNKWNTGAAPGTNEWVLGIGAGGNSDRPTFGIQSGTTSYGTASADDISLNEWHLLTGVREGSEIKLYVDGILEGTKTVGTVSVNNAGRNIRIANSHLNNYYTDGMFDDVRIYDRALKETEILELAQPGNQAPIVNAGPDQNIILPIDSVTLSGSAIDDGLPSGSTLSTEWSKLSGPGNVVFGDANLLNTTASFSQEGNYQLELTASDGLLTSSDIMEVLVQTEPPDGSTPIGHWSMDDVSGTTVTDSSGNNLHGVLVNGAQWDSNGKISGAVSCDGENDYVEIPDDDLLDPGSSDFTVSFWVYKRVSSSGYDNIWGVNKWNTGAAPGTNEWVLGIGAGGNSDRPTFGIQSGTTSYGTASADDISLNEWHLLTGVREGSEIKLYVDGVLEGTKTVGTVSVNNVGRNIRIANSHLNYYYTDGMFDDLRIYDRALSAEEISALFTPVPLSFSNNIVQTYSNITICLGDSIFIDGYWQKSEGIFMEKFRIAPGFDSISTISLKIEELPTVNLGADFTMNTTEEFYLDAYFPDAVYRWQDGSTDHDYLVSQEGDYYVVVKNLCGSRSDSVKVRYNKSAWSDEFHPLTISPNPFTNSLRLIFYLSKQEKVIVTIYSIQGYLVKTLVNNMMEEGTHELIWNGTGDTGQTLQSGIYFLKLITKSSVTHKTIVKKN